ncbi:hypothetical protein MSEN_31380 [Mycolicibacter senuensis]|uniref:Uncharacterized protein n=1 Tax=Mycolicibacter senuensis TaxID=386913 RepID=A0A7I9XNT9_9MYCO|nr:hypothetical protein MSEN_31380 [Mycolicibacter senuensis]
MAKKGSEWLGGDASSTDAPSTDSAHHSLATFIQPPLRRLDSKATFVPESARGPDVSRWMGRGVLSGTVDCHRLCCR